MRHPTRLDRRWSAGDQGLSGGAALGTAFIFGAGFGAFFYNVVDRHGEKFTLYTLSGAPREAFQDFGHPRATPVFGPTFHGTAIVRSDDITADPRYGTMPPHHGMPPGHLPVRSYLAIPVKSRSGVVLGGLFFGHPDPGRFTERVERLITSGNRTTFSAGATEYWGVVTIRSKSSPSRSSNSSKVTGRCSPMSSPTTPISGFPTRCARWGPS